MDQPSSLLSKAITDPDALEVVAFGLRYFQEGRGALSEEEISKWIETAIHVQEKYPRLAKLRIPEDIERWQNG